MSTAGSKEKAEVKDAQVKGDGGSELEAAQAEPSATIAKRQTVTDNEGDPYRYSNVIPLLPGDVLGNYHYMLLYHYMELYFGIDKDSEVICPGDSRYDVFIRIHTFDVEARNAITEFNDLMDIVYVPEDQKDHQDGDPSDNDDDSRVDDGDNLKLKDNTAAKTEDTATGQTDLKAAQAENDAGSKDT